MVFIELQITRCNVVVQMTALSAYAGSARLKIIGVILVNHTFNRHIAIVLNGQGTTVNHAFFIVFVSVCSPVCEAMHVIITANITDTI